MSDMTEFSQPILVPEDVNNVKNLNGIIGNRGLSRNVSN